MGPWAARLGFAVVAPLLFFASVEAGLRLMGFGRNVGFFIPDDRPGWCRTNPRYTELFFPASFGLKPLNFRLPKVKPAGSVRIFVVGESAAMGVPEPGFSVAAQLRAQLRAAHPGRDIEVYNLGVTAINSHVVLHIVRQALQLQPDLLVVYMGNNEVVGPYAPGSAVGDAGLPLGLIRTSVWLRGTRTGQLLERILHAVGLGGRENAEWRGMEMFMSRTVRADDPRMEGVYRNFAANLAAILDLARREGIKTVLSTVAVDVKDAAPFASVHRPALSAAQLQTWRETVDQAELALGLGEASRAQGLLEQARMIDPGYANTHYRLAKLFDERGDAGAARPEYFAALQQDALRFRCDPRLNEIIRQEARTTSGTVALVDAAKVMGADETSTVALAGHELFFEHVHLTWKGNYELARLLAAAAEPMLFGGDGASVHWLSSSQCAHAVGYGAYGRATMLRRMAEMTARPPFSGQLGFAADRARLEEEITAADAALATPESRRTVAEAIEAASRRDPENAFLVFHAAAANLQRGDAARALEFNNRLSTLEPASAEDAAQRAFLLQQLGRTGEAEELLLQSAADDPDYFQTYALLGNLWMTTGQIPKARAYFKALTTRMPESIAVRLSDAQILAAGGDWAGAEREWRAVLRLVPDNEIALAPLVEGLYQRHQSDAAIDLMLKAFAYNPRDFANNARLETIFEAKGDLPATVTYMQAMAESGPVPAVLHADLALNLARLGRREEMLVELRRARAAATAEGDAELLRRVDGLIRENGPGAP